MYFSPTALSNTKKKNLSDCLTGKAFNLHKKTFYTKTNKNILQIFLT